MNRQSHIQKLVTDFLSTEFERRHKQNPKYSMRAFARNIEIDSSYLSKILSGKRKPSLKNIRQLSESLQFPQTIVAELIGHLPQALFKGVDAMRFQIISDWYHYAILETSNLDCFKSDPKWISQYLGISLEETNKAIYRLKTCGLLEITKSGKWIVGNNTTTVNRFSNEAFCKMQSQILEQAIQALRQVSMEERDQSSITMCIDKKRLAQAKKKIRDFRRELMTFLEGGDSKDEVYHLSVSLFPASQKTRKSEVRT